MTVAQTTINRVSGSDNWPSKRLEPCAGKLACTVLRGGSSRKAASLPDLAQLRAAYMPDAARAAFRQPPNSSRRKGHPPVLTSSNPLSTLHQRFACARLSGPYLPGSRPDVSATLTTIALYDSSLQWFGIGT